MCIYFVKHLRAETRLIYFQEIQFYVLKLDVLKKIAS